MSGESEAGRVLLFTLAPTQLPAPTIRRFWAWPVHPMKAIPLLKSALHRAGVRVASGLGVMLVLLLPVRLALAATVVSLGTAGKFAVLAGAGITVAGAIATTYITGDIGTHPTPAITGQGNLILIGTNHAGNAVTQAAKADLVTAYDAAAGRAFGTTYAGGHDLAGSTLAPGVYHSDSSLFLSGNLTLDAQGNPDAAWLFQTGSTLITAADSHINLINGAEAAAVAWQVGSSATLGTDSTFSGSILALTDITANTGAEVTGQLLARNGAVTLDSNVIALAERDAENPPTHVPDGGGTLLLLGSGLLGVFALRQRR